MTPFELAALIGAVTGCFSASYLIIKAITNKPKLTFEEGSMIFYPAVENNYFTTIIIPMKVHNRGSKPTTIYHSKLTFNYNSQHKEIEYDRGHLEVLPDRTEDFNPNLNLHKDYLIIHDKITNCVLTITHTHGKNVINLGTIEEYKN